MNYFSILHQEHEVLKNSEIKGVEHLIAPIAALLIFVYLFQWYITRDLPLSISPTFSQKQPPLVMQGGDPYIRALMRTISASEANSNQPYSLLYSGQKFSDFSHHPAICITIIVGPNQGNCSTAAGRYQIINTTWYQIAPRYHPHPSKLMLWTNYSFEPVYQDIVVYRWLSDPQVWGIDISLLLHQGKLDTVLKLLSPTWTSLGYGIETNANTKFLSQIYQKVLKEELTLQHKPVKQPDKSPINPQNKAGKIYL